MPHVLQIPVRVLPRGSRSEIIGAVDGRLKIKTTAPPADGRANEDVSRQLARAFKVPASRVTLIRGARARLKLFTVERPQTLPGWLKNIDFS